MMNKNEHPVMFQKKGCESSGKYKHINYLKKRVHYISL